MTIGNSIAWWRLLSAAACVMLASRAAYADDPDVPETHEAIVRLVPGASVLDFVARYPLHIDQAGPILASVPSRGFYRLKLTGASGLDLVDLLQTGGDPDVALQPDGRVWAEENYQADASEGSGRNFFLNVVPTAAVYLSQPAWMGPVGLAAAQQLSTGSGVIVAVVDTGVDAAHPALAGRIQAGGWNFACENTDPFTCAGDGNPNFADVGSGVDSNGDGSIDEMTGHGTHMAGIIALMAPDARILPVRVLNSDGDANNFTVAQGIYHAIDHGAAIINASLGSTYKGDMLEAAIDEALAAGIVVVASAGNLGRDRPEEYPAMMSDVLGVIAVDEADHKAPFSNWGPDVALSAPGTAIYSAIPGGLYAQWDGTSMSTAMASGAAALVLARHPEWPATAARVSLVTAALQNSAVNIDPLNDPNYGGNLGAGRLDVGVAVLQRCPLGPCRGDTDCNGTVNQFDIHPFIGALTDPAQYSTDYPGCDVRSADCNYDGSVNGFDIQSFLALLAP